MSTLGTGRSFPLVLFQSGVSPVVYTLQMDVPPDFVKEDVTGEIGG